MSVDLLSRKIRKARKEHKCDYCGEIIKKGEFYEYSKLTYEGIIYDWKNHNRCALVAKEIWDYVDPDEGMDEEDFCNGCNDICYAFICPDCQHWNKEYKECENDHSYCIDKLETFFKTNEIYKAGRKGFEEIWKSRKKEGK